jgi:hypothetical protein
VDLGKKIINNDTTDNFAYDLGKNIKSSSLKAAITSVTISGLATVTFSEPIIIPVNFTSFNETQLTINLTD